MLTYGERVILRETAQEKKNVVSEYIDCTVDEFNEIVEASLPTSLSERSNIEIQLCRLAQLYVSEKNADYADKVYNALVKYANNHFVIRQNADISDFDSDCYTLQPVYPAIAYSLLADYSVGEFDELYNTDTRHLIESWLYDVAEITYTCFNNKTAGNLSGYTVKHIAGIGVVLDNPLIMRWAISIADNVMNQRQWHSDGMWWEGSISYCRQAIGNLNEALPLISRFKDPEGYKDTLLGLTLNETDISSRYPMIKYSSDAMSKLVNPDGTLITVHDTHPTYNSVVGLDLPIKEEYLNNVEFNHFGLFALKSGNTQNAQQVSMLFPPILSGVPFSGGHYHGNFLTMSLWAAGQELLPDAGYPFQVANHRYFHMSPVVHNGSWIWDDSASDYGNYMYKSSRPNLLRYDDGTQSSGNIQLIEASQLMDKGMNIKDKRRLLMQIKTSENTSYVFDLQTLEGGDVHENFLRASEDEDVTVITSAQSTGSAENLGKYLKDNGKKGLLPNETLFTDAKFYSDDDIDFTFEGDTSGSRLNAFVKGVDNSFVAISSMPSLRRTGGDAAYKDDFPTKHFYQHREVGAGDVTHFAAVYEGIHAEDSAYISDVEWIENANSLFAVIDLGQYEDIICISDNFDDKVYDNITFKTNIGWIRRYKNNKKVASGYIYGGGEIYTDSGILKCEDSFEAQVQAISRSLYGKNSLFLDENIPDNFNGRWGNLTFADGSGFSHEIVEIAGRQVVLHNDVGFDYANNKLYFTSFPSKQSPDGSLWMNEMDYTKFTDRTLNGSAIYRVDDVTYRDFSGELFVFENGNEFESVKAGSQYVVKNSLSTDTITMVAVYNGTTLINAYISRNGDDLSFTLGNEIYAPASDGMMYDVYIKCMLWNDKMQPLCEALILR